MKKILIVTGSFITGKGGVASYAHDFIEAFENEYLISVITGDDFISSTKKSYTVYNFNLVDFSKKNALNLLKIIEIEKPDIIINSSAPIFNCVLPFINKNVNIVSISHFVNGILADIAGFNSLYINNIVALSNFGKKYISKKFKIKDNLRVSVVYNYMNSNTDANKLNKKKTSEKLTIVFPGGTGYYKSADIVLGALLILLKTKLEFNFYWLGKSKILNKSFPLLYNNLDKMLPKDNRIKHIGSLNRFQSIQTIEDANIFLLPSRGEGCPISLLEAMNVGTIPIISDAKHGSYEIIENTISGLVSKQDNVKVLYELLTNVITNNSNYSHIYDNSLKKFNSLLTRNIWVDNMKEVFNKNNELDRELRFSNYQFFKYSLKMRGLLFLEYLKSRIRLLKHVLRLNIIYLKYK